MANKSKKILSEISAGELLDKISILEIKLEKIKDKNDLEDIKKEYNILKEVQSNNIELTEPVKKLFVSIKKINLTLWDVEYKLRVCEKNKDFSQTFINLARDVYFNNDQRAKIKSQINTILGSNIKEIKQYSDY